MGCKRQRSEERLLASGFDLRSRRIPNALTLGGALGGVIAGAIAAALLLWLTLGEVLARRTSVEPSGVVALDPEDSELAFFPFIYWPVTSEQTELSSKALQNIQDYIDHGGTIGHVCTNAKCERLG